MKILKKLWPIKSWHFIVLAIVLAASGVVGLRNNNVRMAEIREDVFAADEAGEGIGASLDELRGFVFSHMNASTEVELKFTYERAAEAAIKENNNVTSNANIFEGLPSECGGSASFADSTDPCVRDFIDRRIAELGGENPTPTSLPDKNLYIYTFESPLLSLDFAGISLLLSLLSVFAAVGMIGWNFVKNELSFYTGDIEGL